MVQFSSLNEMTERMQKDFKSLESFICLILGSPLFCTNNMHMLFASILLLHVSMSVNAVKFITHSVMFQSRCDDFRQVRGALNEFQPELVIYNAGTDILDGDPLGMLSVTGDASISWAYSMKTAAVES